MSKKNHSDAEGFGDTIAYLTELLKIDKVIKTATEAMGIEDCGCDRRKQKLNKMFPYKKNEEKKED
jgi:hypothetical protein